MPGASAGEIQPDRTEITGIDAGPLDLFATLARTALFLEAVQRECLGEHSLSFAEYSVLRLLQRAPGGHLAPSWLAEQLVYTTGAMTKLVDRLQRAGLVERAPDPRDRRGVLVEVTRAGDRKATEAADTYEAGRQRILDQLGDRNTERIHSSLRQLLAVLEADRSQR